MMWRMKTRKNWQKTSNSQKISKILAKKPIFHDGEDENQEKTGKKNQHLSENQQKTGKKINFFPKVYKLSAMSSF